MKRKVKLLISALFLALLLAGCGKQEAVSETVPAEDTASEEVQSNEAEAGSNAEAESSENTETATEETEKETEKETEEEITQTEETEAVQEAAASYERTGSDKWMKGFWTNGEETFYFNSFELDGRLVRYFTRTDEPDVWYQYTEVKEEEFVDATQDRYFYRMYTFDIISSEGESFQGKFGLTTDDYTLAHYMVMQAGDSLMNLQQVFPAYGFHDAANYMKFIVAKPDEAGKVNLSYVDLTQTKYIYNIAYEYIVFDDMNEGYHSYDNESYYGFTEGPIEGYDEMYVVEVSHNFFLDFAYPDFPYLDGPIEKPEKEYDVFSGYLVKDGEGNSYLYQPGEGMRMKEYNFASGLMSFDFGAYSFSVNGISKEEYEKAIADKEAQWVLSEDWGEGYYDGQYYLMTEKGYFRAGTFMRDTPEIEQFADNIAAILDALELSENGTYLEAHLKEIVDFNGHKFKDDAVFTSVKQGDNTDSGIEEIHGELPGDNTGRFTYYLYTVDNFEKATGVDADIAQSDGSTIKHSHCEMMYDAPHSDEFEMCVRVNDNTNTENILYAHVLSQPRTYLIITQFDGNDSYNSGRYNLIRWMETIFAFGNATEEEEPITLEDSQKIGETETQGVNYIIYDKIGNTGLSGAKCVFIDETYILQEEIEYEGAIYPVIVFGGSSEYLKVTDYTIPEHIKYFDGLGKMEVVNLTIPDTVEFINLSTPFCNDLKTVSFPEGLECYSTQNWDRTFMWCYDIESITIPDGAKCLVGSVDGTFEGCGNLTEVILPNTVEIIGTKCLFGCGSLETVNISDNTKQISDKAFYGCENLTSITLPDGLESIGKSAFEYCESLEELIIPESVTETTGLFRGCKNLKKIVFPKEVEIMDWYSFDDSKVLESIVFPLSVTEDDFKKLSLPNSVKLIEVPEELTAYLQKKYPNIEVKVREA